MSRKNTQLVDRPNKRVLALSICAVILVLVLVAIFAQRENKVSEIVADSSSTPAEFVGSETCGGCHLSEMTEWRKSQHAHAMQEATEKTMLGNFNNARFAYAGLTSTFFTKDGRFFVNTDGPDGKLADFEIKYTFGIYPLQQYLIAFPDGRLQALSISWDSRLKEQGGQRWFHLYPGQNIRAGDRLHWTGLDQNWNFMCADCHSTNLRKNYDAANKTFHTTWSDITVGCETCHGPGSAHVAWAKQLDKKNIGKGLTVALDERRDVVWKIDAMTGNALRNKPRDSHREIGACAQCHSRRSQLTDEHHADESFFDRYAPVGLEQPLYHSDGQQREEVYVWGSFLQSKMHAKGVTCSDCHNPHTQQLRAPGNAVCAQCHTPAKYDSPQHHFHTAASTGAQCVNCHMPQTTYMEVDPRRDHSLRIPRPDLSVSFGVPNACNQCHKDRKAEWADAAVQRWYGHRPRGFQQFAASFDAMGRGQPSAAADLAALAIDPLQPAIVRATAINGLARSPDASSPQTISIALRDGDPLVRREALRALEFFPPDRQLALGSALLNDPVRMVRIEAAASLADVPDAKLTGDLHVSFQRAAEEFEKSQRYNADRPESRMLLGNFFARRSRTAAAEEEYKAALALDPNFVAAYINYADLKRTTGEDSAAEALLRQGLKSAPQEAALHHALGLALVRLKRIDEALNELTRATQLAPQNIDFAYVRAVGLQSTGKLDQALAELERGLKINPDDRNLLSAAVSFSREKGDENRAKKYEERLKEVTRN